MGLQAVRLDNLSQIGLGVFTEMFEAELTKVVRDITGRQRDPSKRRVIFELEIEPDPDSEVADVAHLRAKCYSRMPKQQSRSFSVGLLANGGVVYRDGSPENVRQTNFGDLNETKESIDDSEGD